VGRGLAILLAALVLAACGGGGALSHDEYEAKVAEVVTSIAVAVDVSPETPPFEQRERLRAAAGALREAGDELAGVDPPDDAAEAHAVFVEAVGELGDQIEALLAETDAITDPVELNERFGDLQQFPALKELDRVSSMLARAGYEFG
jgi:hypothetical protein